MAHIERITDLADKQRHRALLLLADPDWDVVMGYLPDGVMYVLYEGDVPVCEAVMTARDDGQIELKNLATDPAHQRKGCARRLIAHLFEQHKGQYREMYVGTAFPGLYEKFGFEPAYTVKNFFVDHYPEPIYDEGRQCVDMLYYRMTLDKG